MAGGSDTGFVHINSQMLGIGTISLAFMDNAEIDSPVGPDVTVSVPANSGNILTLADPLHFQGIIDFRAVPGSNPNGTPSFVGLVGVTADHWTWANSVLTLYAGNQVTDTLKVIPGSSEWAVYTAPGGVQLSSSPLMPAVAQASSFVQLDPVAHSASV